EEAQHADQQDDHPDAEAEDAGEPERHRLDAAFERSDRLLLGVLLDGVEEIAHFVGAPRLLVEHGRIPTTPGAGPCANRLCVAGLRSPRSLRAAHLEMRKRRSSSASVKRGPSNSRRAAAPAVASTRYWSSGPSGARAAT